MSKKHVVSGFNILEYLLTSYASDFKLIHSVSNNKLIINNNNHYRMVAT